MRCMHGPKISSIKCMLRHCCVEVKLQMPASQALQRRFNHAIAEWGARDIYSAALFEEPIVPKYHVEPFHSAEEERLALESAPISGFGVYPPTRS